MFLTYKYRIKDSTSKLSLARLAGSVNFVWNYVNDLSSRSIKQHNRFLSEYDVDKYLTGAAKELGLTASSLQEISKVYVKSRKQHKKAKLSWRSSKKKTLGWIPFKAAAIKVLDDSVRYCEQLFRFYKSRPLPADAVIKTGSFVQDSRDRWYLCITFATENPTVHINDGSSVGIDLGIKNQAALSNGVVFSRENITTKYAKKLATAQRANKKKQTRNLHAKMANLRLDWMHKTTTSIAKEFANIYVGDLKVSDLTGENKTRNKGLYDASIAGIQHCLIYKASKLGGVCKLVPEYDTTRMCNQCYALTGPYGEKDLCVREWTCTCGACHNRDTNSALNILRIGHYTP